MPLTINETYLTKILQRFVQIDSSNPDLTPGSPGEAEIGQFTADLLREIGLEVVVHDLGHNRINVVGSLPGKGGGKSLMLNAHMDTVGVEGMAEPFSGEIRDGRLYGRGSQDMKGSLAAQIAAAKALVDAGISLAGDLIIACVADEEYASIGTEDVVKHYKTDAAIVTEPTDLMVCSAHRGFVWYEVETIGRAAHGSRYQEGIDANMHMGRFLGELDKLEQELQTRELHPLVGHPSLHAAQIQGGTALSVYADRCVLKVERRLNPGETVAQATGELQAIIDKLAQQDSTFKATLKTIFQRMPYEINENAEIIGVVDAIIEKHSGKRPLHIGMSGWTDASILGDAGIEAILLGPIGEGLHSAEEWVDVQSVFDLAVILAETAVHYCGT